MKILTDENGNKWEVLHKNTGKACGAGDVVTTAITVRPVPPPIKSLEEEFWDCIDMDRPFSDEACRVVKALCFILGRRLAKLEGK